MIAAVHVHCDVALLLHLVLSLAVHTGTFCPSTEIYNFELQKEEYTLLSYYVTLCQPSHLSITGKVCLDSTSPWHPR